MIVDQHMPIKEVSKELGVSTDSLRTWLKNAGLNPNSANKDIATLKGFVNLKISSKPL